jgi:hypothetical protein
MRRTAEAAFAEAQCRDALFPGYRLDILGGPRGIGLVWDAA